MQDQNVMFPIAVYMTAASTGDLDWLATMRPALDAIAKYPPTFPIRASQTPEQFCMHPELAEID